MQDGSYVVRKDKIKGGAGGVAVIGSAVDTNAVLDRLKIERTSGTAVQTFECCGLTSTFTKVSGTPHGPDTGDGATADAGVQEPEPSLAEP